MNRLPSEMQRLYLPSASDCPGTGADESGLVDAGGRVRAMVLELARPADWPAVWRVWQGVQADLELPAPAIAVNGIDGYQLWFSLVEPVSAQQAAAFLESLRIRYLGEIRSTRIGLLPAVDPSSAAPVRHAGPVPAQQAGGEHWSAFVAPDLAPMFADEPWLDMPPNPDGQAVLLSQLDSIPLADLQYAEQGLRPTVSNRPAGPASALAGPAAAQRTGLAPADARRDAKRFLLDVMNDHTVALRLRIEAAKALLPYVDEPPRP